MATTINNGTIVFGDATIKSTANFAWTGSSSISGLTSVPTQLSQFTNDLGNYGGFLTSANATAGYSLSDPSNILNVCGSRRGNVGHRTSGDWNLTWNGSVVGLQVNNCNCNCNC